LGAFLLNTGLPYVFGGFGSGALIIWLLALAAGLTFAATTLVEKLQSRIAAHLALGAVALLSILTIWLDFYIVAALSPFGRDYWEGLAQEAVTETIAQLLALPINLIFSAIWVFVWIFVAREMDDELYVSTVAKNQQREMKVLVEEAFPEPILAEAVIQSPPAEQVSCEICGTELVSTKRFCTHCGAPLRQGGGTS